MTESLRKLSDILKEELSYELERSFEIFPYYFVPLYLQLHTTSSLSTWRSAPIYLKHLGPDSIFSIKFDPIEKEYLTAYDNSWMKMEKESLFQLLYPRQVYAKPGQVDFTIIRDQLKTDYNKAKLYLNNIFKIPYKITELINSLVKIDSQLYSHIPAHLAIPYLLINKNKILRYTKHKENCIKIDQTWHTLYKFPVAFLPELEDLPLDHIIDETQALNQHQSCTKDINQPFELI